MSALQQMLRPLLRADIKRRALLLGGGALLTGCGGQMHGLRRRVGFVVVNARLLLHGEVTKRTPREFAQVMAQNPQVTTIVLQDMPDARDDHAVLELGYRVRELGLETELQSDSDIAKGAVPLFLAGVRRRMVEGAGIGLSSWVEGSKVGRDLPEEASEHSARRKYVQDMLGSDAFYWFALQAAPEGEIHNMTAQEVVRYGLLTEPVKVWN